MRLKGYNKVSAGDVVRSHHRAVRAHKHVSWRLTEDSMGQKTVLKGQTAK